MTRRGDIRAAILDALNTGTPTGVPDAQKRLGPFAPSELPAVRLATGRELVSDKMPNGKRGPVATRRCHFHLECYVSTDEDDLEPMLAWATKALIPGRLGGLAIAIEETGTQWQAAGEDHDYVKATMVVMVEYVTAVGDQDAGLPA